MDSKTQKILADYRKRLPRDELALQIYLGCMEIENKSASLEKVPKDLERYTQSELDLGLNIELKEKSKNRRKSQHLLDLISLAKDFTIKAYVGDLKNIPYFKTPQEIENYFNKINQDSHRRFSRWPY